MERAADLSPRDPQIGNWESRIGLAYLVQSRIDDAILWLEKARVAAPELPWVHLRLAAAYGLKGETTRRHGNRRGAADGPSWSRFEHRPVEVWTLAADEHPCALRNHLLRWPTQGRGARRIIAAASALTWLTAVFPASRSSVC
jgi:hypothetical protein